MVRENSYLHRETCRWQWKPRTSCLTAAVLRPTFCQAPIEWENAPTGGRLSSWLPIRHRAAPPVSVLLSVICGRTIRLLCLHKSLPLLALLWDCSMRQAAYQQRWLGCLLLWTVLNSFIFLNTCIQDKHTQSAIVYWLLAGITKTYGGLALLVLKWQWLTIPKLHKQKRSAL